MNNILVTGATGLLGKELMKCLLQRNFCIYVLCRPASSRIHELCASWRNMDKADRASVEILWGDITQPNLGRDATESPFTFQHVFHLAGLYDLTATAERLQECNVTGTQYLLDWLDTQGFSGIFHHASSVAVAGDHQGIFHETDVDLGQKHPHPYHASKFAGEQTVRQKPGLRFRIYRPTALVGHSRTGEMDRIDGLYYLFKPIRKLRDLLPRWFPLYSNRKMQVNVLPVDYAARAIDAIAFTDHQDQKTFHIVDPQAPSFQTTFNWLADAAGAPRIQGKGLGRLIPQDWLNSLGSVQYFRDLFLTDNEIPHQIVTALNRHVTYDCKQAQAILLSQGIYLPSQEEYLPFVWDYWLRHLDPDRSPTLRHRRHLENKKVLITGASSGVGAAFAAQAARAGAHVLLVARRETELQQVADQIIVRGGKADIFPTDLSEIAAIDGLIQKVIDTHGTVDVLVNNAAHSIRRDLSESLDRYHDFERVMRLNFFAPIRLIRGFLPKMQEQKHGYIINVLTAGVAMATPRFAAYASSKAALSHLTDTMAVELLSDGVHCAGIYLPWVRTPMMDATGIYKETDAMTPDDAALWIMQAITERKQHVLNASTRRRWTLNAWVPEQLTRLIHLFSRIYHDDETAHPELETERMLLKRLFKGKLI